MSGNNFSLECKNCGGKLTVDPNQAVTICPYCGTNISTSELLNESDAVKIQKIKSEAYVKIETGKQELQSQQLNYVVAQEQKQNEEKKLKEFKKSKFSKVLIVFAVISLLMCAVGFKDGRILAGIVALVQTALFFASWLMGMQIIKENRY